MVNIPDVRSLPAETNCSHNSTWLFTLTTVSWRFTKQIFGPLSFTAATPRVKMSLMWAQIWNPSLTARVQPAAPLCLIFSTLLLKFDLNVERNVWLLCSQTYIDNWCLWLCSNVWKLYLKTLRFPADSTRVINKSTFDCSFLWSRHCSGVFLQFLHLFQKRLRTAVLLSCRPSASIVLWIYWNIWLHVMKRLYFCSYTCDTNGIHTCDTNGIHTCDTV